MVVHIFNMSTGEAEAGLSEFNANLVYTENSRLYQKILSQKDKSKNKTKIVSFETFM